MAKDIKKFKKDTTVAVVKKGIASVINMASSGNTGVSGILEDTYSKIFKNNNRSILVN